MYNKCKYCRIAQNVMKILHWSVYLWDFALGEGDWGNSRGFWVRFKLDVYWILEFVMNCLFVVFMDA